MKILLSIFLITILFHLYDFTCTDCGTYGYCLNTTSDGNCSQCACPKNFSGACCEVVPTDGCTPDPCPNTATHHYKCHPYPDRKYVCTCQTGWFGENCESKVSSCASNQLPLFMDNFTTPYAKPSNKSYQSMPVSPCGNGNRTCLTTTINGDWWSGRGTPGDGASYEVVLNCDNPCIKDKDGVFWSPNDMTYTRMLLRPYCNTSAGLCAIYVYQSWVNSTGYQITPANNGSGLVSANGIRPILTQRGPTGKDDPIPIGDPRYDYIEAIGVSCIGCSFETPTCEVAPRPPPCTIDCKNGGICRIDENGTSYCDCYNIWSGEDCSTFDPCSFFATNSNYSCLNGGTCYSNSTLFPYSTCICPEGYCGSRCEKTGCIWPESTYEQLDSNIRKSNFNQAYLPYLLANLTTEQKSNMSWQITDLYSWASYERTELDLGKDLTKWYESSMGNCFTFNHENASKIYNLRYAGEPGGFKAQMKIEQSQYMNWVYTASLLLFLHKKEETIMGESMSYNMAPGEETTFVVQRNAFTRLSEPYGVCIQNKNQVKSYYNPGSAYTLDSCFRSCYQDYVQEKCGCMDSKYFMSDTASACDISKKDCVDNITKQRGEPSTWSECYCPPPCNEYIFDVSWTKTVLKTYPIECQNSNFTDEQREKCFDTYKTVISVFSVHFPRLFHKVFAEKPKYTWTYILTTLSNVTGLMLGFSIICLFELFFLFLRLFHVLCMNKSAIHHKYESKENEAKTNIFNTVSWNIYHYR